MKLRSPPRLWIGALIALFICLIPSQAHAAENLTWSLSDAGVLTVSGVGKLPIFHTPEDQPWHDVRNDIKEVYFVGTENFTIPNMQYWFTDCVSLQRTEIPYTAKIIGAQAFANCTSLSEIFFYYYDEDDFEIVDGAFYVDSPVDTSVYLVSDQTQAIQVIVDYKWEADNRHTSYCDVYTKKPFITYASFNCLLCDGPIIWTLGWGYHCERCGTPHTTAGCGLNCGACNGSISYTAIMTLTHHRTINQASCEHYSPIDTPSPHSIYGGGSICSECLYGLSPYVVVTLNIDGIEIPSLKSTGSKITRFPDDPVKEGYTFTGWFTAASGGTQVTTTTVVPSTNTTYYAQWTANSCTITWNGNGGTSPSASSKTYGSTLGTLPTSSRTGYTFKGWSTSSSGSVNVNTSTTVSGSVTYYAVWTINTSSLKIDPAGGTYNGSASVQTFSGNYGSTTGVGVPVRTGYTFAGWSRSGSYGTLGSYNGTTYPYTFGTTNGAVDTITATWTINTSTLTINPNGGAWGGTTSNSPKTQNYNTTLTIANPTITNYTASFSDGIASKTTNKSFASWTASGSAGTLSGTTFTFGATKNGTGTLTANWNGSYSITLPTAPTKTGYTFSKWSDGTNTYNAGASVTLSKNTSYISTWTPNTYTVTWDAQNGSAMSTSSQTYDTTISIPSQPSKINSHFDGWWTDPISGTRVTDATVFQTASNVTYYAHWIQVFSVTVPTSVGAILHPDGSLTVSDISITNNSTGDITVSSLTVNSVSDWSVVSSATDMSRVKVDSKQVSFEASKALPWNVAVGETIQVPCSAKISAVSETYTNEPILTLTFVVEWAT